MRRRAVFNLFAALLAAGMGGCVIVDVGVTNPIPGLSSVAVAPFFNQSAERAVDGRQVAMAYAAELQKVPGFQVVPVGVTELAIREHNLHLSGPDDALKLAAILGVDAVVVGAVTDFDPYYPPRIGLAVNWYSPLPWTFWPGLPIDPKLREDLRQGRLDPPADEDIDIVDPQWNPAGKDRGYRRLWRQIKTPQIVRGQSREIGCLPESGSAERNWQPTDMAARPVATPDWTVLLREAANNPVGGMNFQTSVADLLPGPALAAPEPFPLPGTPALPIPVPHSPAAPCEPPTRVPAPASTLPPGLPVAVPFDPRQPLMSYTRLFDGADAELTARLRDYLELRNDLRPGSWPAALRRSDDFLRFAAHLMIAEMLTLHGGEGRRRVVLKFREH